RSPVWRVSLPIASGTTPFRAGTAWHERLLKTAPERSTRRPAHGQYLSGAYPAPEGATDMAATRTGGVLERLRKAALARDGCGLSDGQLLERYVAGRDEAAFEALVRRHGPMVWGVVRRVAGNGPDAED